MDSKINPYSHLTAKERDNPSFPTKWLYRQGLLKGEILDFGCGLGADGEFLQTKGLSVTNYDKHYFPDFPAKKFDVIICHYVLNVLFQEEQADVLMQISELLKPGGKAYFSVRRDLTTTGFRIHKVHKLPTYQCNVTLPFKSVLLNEFCEIYEYQHYNLVAAKSDCVFCKPEADREIICESATAFALRDKYPVSEGHLLVVPKRHTETYFELSLKEQTAIWLMVNHLKQNMDKELSPDGYNVGFNCNEAAGQTIFHTHVHIIPRYKGDSENPIGGIRKIVSGEGRY